MPILLKSRALSDFFRNRGAIVIERIEIGLVRRNWSALLFQFFGGSSG